MKWLMLVMAVALTLGTLDTVYVSVFHADGERTDYALVPNSYEYELEIEAEPGADVWYIYNLGWGHYIQGETI